MKKYSKNSIELVKAYQNYELSILIPILYESKLALYLWIYTLIALGIMFGLLIIFLINL